MSFGLVGVEKGRGRVHHDAGKIEPAYLFWCLVLVVEGHIVSMHELYRILKEKTSKTVAFDSVNRQSLEDEGLSLRDDNLTSSAAFAAS